LAFTVWKIGIQASGVCVAVAQKIDKELATAIAALDKEKEAALKDLDAQVDKLSAQILARVLPEGVKL
jgi:F-type H+-transporting ATPase subunit b